MTDLNMRRINFSEYSCSCSYFSALYANQNSLSPLICSHSFGVRDLSLDVGVFFLPLSFTLLQKENADPYSASPSAAMCVCVYRTVGLIVF